MRASSLVGHARALALLGGSLAALASLAGCFALFGLEGYGNAIDSPLEPDATPPSGEAGAADAKPGVTGNVVFVTQAAHAVGRTAQAGEAGFASVAEADAICAAAATAAGLKGTFRAWLADGDTSPLTSWPGPLAALGAGGGVDRIDASAATTPILTTKKVVIAATWAELLDGGPRVAIDTTERGDALDAAAELQPDLKDLCPAGAVWTGTAGSRAGSSAAETHCSAWRSNSEEVTGTAGTLSKNKKDWTSACELPCSLRAHLYCFQQ